MQIEEKFQGEYTSKWIYPVANPSPPAVYRVTNILRVDPLNEGALLLTFEFDQIIKLCTEQLVNPDFLIAKLPEPLRDRVNKKSLEEVIGRNEISTLGIEVLNGEGVGGVYLPYKTAKSFKEARLIMEKSAQIFNNSIGARLAFDASFRFQGILIGYTKYRSGRFITPWAILLNPEESHAGFHSSNDIKRFPVVPVPDSYTWIDYIESK